MGERERERDLERERVCEVVAKDRAACALPSKSERLEGCIRPKALRSSLRVRAKPNAVLLTVDALTGERKRKRERVCDVVAKDKAACALSSKSQRLVGCIRPKAFRSGLRARAKVLLTLDLIRAWLIEGGRGGGGWLSSGLRSCGRVKD